MQKLRFSISDLASSLDLDRATLKRRLVNLAPIEGPNNAKLYDLGAVVKELTASKSQANVERQIQRENLRIQTAKADSAEIDLAVQRREYASVAEIGRDIAKEYSILRTRLRQVPTAMALQLSRVDNPNEVRSLLTDAIDEALTALVADAKSELAAHQSAVDSQNEGKK